MTSSNWKSGQSVLYNRPDHRAKRRMEKMWTYYIFFYCDLREICAVVKSRKRRRRDAKIQEEQFPPHSPGKEKGKQREIEDWLSDLSKMLIAARLLGPASVAICINTYIYFIWFFYSGIIKSRTSMKMNKTSVNILLLLGEKNLRTSIDLRRNQMNTLKEEKRKSPRTRRNGYINVTNLWTKSEEWK